MAIDSDRDEILAYALTDQNQGDPTQVGTLLDQIAGGITSVTADGAYDGDPVDRAVADRAPIAGVIIPLRSTAKPGAQAPTQRDRHIQMIKQRGHLGWQRATGYGRRSLVETTMFPYKMLIGWRARSPAGQKAEV